MKRFQKWVTERWPVVVSTVAAGLFILFLFSFRLGSLTDGSSLVEARYLTNAQYLNTIFSAPAFLIHKLLSFFVLALPFESFGLKRLPSVGLILQFTACFYVLVSRWYTTRIALLTTLLFVTSSWTITIGRQALPTVLYLSWLPILALLYWTLSKGKHSLILLLWAFSFGLGLYVPGILWFVVVLAASQRKRLLSLVRSAAKWQTAVAAATLLVLIVPYLFLLVQHPTSAIATLGLPTTATQFVHFPEQLYRLVLQLFIFSNLNPVFHLGHLPYIDIASTVLFGLGLYRLRYSPARKMMAWSGIVTAGWAVGAGFGAVNIAIFLPLIYMFIGGGISFLLVQWFTVFPKNPIARGVGLWLVCFLVLLISFYHLSRYFIAWPLSPQTRAAFSTQTVVK